MEKKKSVIVYVCPFCEAQQYFNRQIDLEFHFYHEHLSEALTFISSKCLKTVSKTEGKWGIIK